VLHEICERTPLLAMLSPVKLPISSLVYHNNSLLASHLADSDTFPDAENTHYPESSHTYPTPINGSLTSLATMSMKYHSVCL